MRDTMILQNIVLVAMIVVSVGTTTFTGYRLGRFLRTFFAISWLSPDAGAWVGLAAGIAAAATALL